jgi:hypothetical protein
MPAADLVEELRRDWWRSVSGQLVGEVITFVSGGSWTKVGKSRRRLHSSGLTERGFHALIAIAEKCHTATRQGSVPWSHIRAGLYGASPSTAKRAVGELKAAGFLRVVKRGFDNQNGRSCAPIYYIAPLSEEVTQVTQSPPNRTGHLDDPIAPTDQVNHVTQSLPTEQITQVTQSPRSERVKTEGRTGQDSDRTGHPADLLNGSTNGSTNGRARAATNAAHQTPATPSTDEEEPSPYCQAHQPWGTVNNCGPCGAAGRIHRAALAEMVEHKQRTAAIKRSTVRDCHQCDEQGWPLDADGLSPDEPGEKCNHQSLHRQPIPGGTTA